MKQDQADAPLSDADIEQIVMQVKDGRQEPFRLLVKHYQRRIHVYCWHMLGHREEAEDAVQDIFIKCYQHIARYTKTSSFTSWLYKIAYNHCINAMKKRNTRYKAFGFYRWQQLNAGCERDYSDLVGEMLSQLSSEERNLLLLRVIDERSYEEIGEIMSCKPATARKKYERIKKRLRPLWSQQVEGLANET
ncbi:MAG: RNA polymerase sigma factor [Paenibacillus dendritiformis]|uniref:RNA polymerase sigma factor n=1 Tax=Paenibacillus dendritiformis TaxID=130049 RepID=UPI00143CC8F8|nr:RNA polymerase sigma factor [Paenibacillus dendritiformis]MDU5145863.1 RNA polymerase sigma factor [Paenibacillus dendritiformis]NKI23227.1 RNA polymerase sigma factor [Paenibacillus dendritiformis]NRG00157.1 RNA polymerase sigma factor [Paenibacillus dendritiformis]GIO71231.1 ECF RNA polymerase sigma factor SigW [Paenibacillus dendritiformis]